MNRIVIGCAFVFAFVTSIASAQEDRLHTDWAYLSRYRDANAALPPPARGEKRVVFPVDSITEGWAQFFGSQFPGKPYVNRGIGGQTTPQMLVRFRQDVIALRPAVVVILADRGSQEIAESSCDRRSAICDLRSSGKSASSVDCCKKEIA